MKKVQEYTTFFTPKFIYVPFDQIELLKIKKSKRIDYNGLLGTRSDGSNIFCPVSGYVINIKEMEFVSGRKNTLIIENDFMDRREKLNPARDMSKAKKADIIASLEKYGLNKKVNSKTVLVINSLYDKKYDLKDMVINYECYEEILEAIDEFMSIFNMKSCYICIDKEDLFSINAYEKYINAFLNICIVSSNKKFKNDTCVFYSVEEILSIYKAIHQDYMYDNTIVTIYYDKPYIMKVRLYSSLLELLRVLKLSVNDKIVLVNNKEINDVHNFIISEDVRSIIIKDKQS